MTSKTDQVRQNFGETRKKLLEIKPRSLFCFPKHLSEALKILDEGNITMSENKEESGLAAMAGEQKVSSTGDQRTVNNVMRHEYKVLNDDEKAAMQKVKDDALAFHEFLDSLGQSRELSLAKTKIEESVFWAVKHITG